MVMPPNAPKIKKTISIAPLPFMLGPVKPIAPLTVPMAPVKIKTIAPTKLKQQTFQNITLGTPTKPKMAKPPQMPAPAPLVLAPQQGPAWAQAPPPPPPTMSVAPTSVQAVVNLPPPPQQLIDYFKSLMPHAFEQSKRSEYAKNLGKQHVEIVSEFLPHVTERGTRQQIGQFIELRITPHKYSMFIYPGVSRLALTELAEKLHFHVKTISKTVKMTLFRTQNKKRHNILKKNLHKMSLVEIKTLLSAVSFGKKQMVHLTLYQDGVTGGAFFSTALHDPIFRKMFQSN